MAGPTPRKFAVSAASTAFVGGLALVVVVVVVVVVELDPWRTNAKPAAVAARTLASALLSTKLINGRNLPGREIERGKRWVNRRVQTPLANRKKISTAKRARCKRV